MSSQGGRLRLLDYAFLGAGALCAKAGDHTHVYDNDSLGSNTMCPLPAGCLHIHDLWTMAAQLLRKAKPRSSFLNQLFNFAKQTIPKHCGLKTTIYLSWFCELTGLSWAVLAQGLSQVVVGARAIRKLFQSHI